MMALGSAGGSGGSSSSSSGLSALAPPFTVDRFNSKPISNSLLLYTDTPYASPFGHTWPYTPHPSAPRPDMSVKPELNLDSTRITSMPLSNSYSYPVTEPSPTQWPAVNPSVKSSTSAFYVTEAMPYHPPFVSSVLSEHSPLVPLSQSSFDSSPSSGIVNASSQADFSEGLSGLEYIPQWRGLWDGFSELKHGNQVESGANFSIKVNESAPVVYMNYLKEVPTVRSGDALKGDSGVLFGKSTDSIQKEIHTGSFSLGTSDGRSFIDQKLGSKYTCGDPIDNTEKDNCSASFNTRNVDEKVRYAQNLGYLPFESSGTQFQGSTSFAESHPSSLFQESSKSFYNYQKTYDPHETGVQPLRTFVQDPASIVKPAHSVIIRPPSNGTTFSAQEPDKIVDIRNFSNVGSQFRDSVDLSKAKEPYMSPRPESIEGSGCTRKIDTEKEGSIWTFLGSSSKAEFPSKPQIEDSILKICHASQFTDTNDSSGFLPSPDYVQAFKFSENPPDSSDNYNLAVDSPCWKGAPGSYASSDIGVDCLSPNHYLKKLDGLNSLDVSGKQTGATKAASPDASVENTHEKNICAGNDKSPSQNSITALNCTAKKHRSDDPLKEVLKAPGFSSSEVREFHSGLDRPRKEFDLLKTSVGCETNYSCSKKCNVEDRFSPVDVNLVAGIGDGRTICNDASEGGAVAYRAAENVLCSPPAREDSEEHCQPSETISTLKVDAPALINAIHSLSELLRLNCSADLCGLNEENQEVLKRVVKNLDACMSKKTSNSKPALEPMFSQQGTSINIGDIGDLHMENSAEQPDQRYQATASSCGQRAHHYLHTEKINHSNCDTKAEYIQSYLPLGHNERFSGDDEMVQAIMMVLDANLNFEEEMQPQSLLFKNLWLDAEARLCSISYRARFDHMRILLDEYKLNKKKEISADWRKIPSSNNSPRVKEASVTEFPAEHGSIPVGTIVNHTNFSTSTGSDAVEASALARFNALMHRDSEPSTEEQRQCNIPGTRKIIIGSKFGSSVGASDQDGHIDDVEAAALARFSILKQRGDKSNEDQQQGDVMDSSKAEGQTWSSSVVSRAAGQIDDVEAAVLTRFNILKRRDNKCTAEELHNMVDTSQAGIMGAYTCGSGYESVKELPRSVSNEAAVQGGREGRSENQCTSGWYDNSSSEWEHVQKDDFRWQKG